jgi:hypothetical protein
MRADEPGVVIVFELDNVEQAKRYVADFPMSKAAYLEWFYIPLVAHRSHRLTYISSREAAGAALRSGSVKPGYFVDEVCNRLRGYG